MRGRGKDTVANFQTDDNGTTHTTVKAIDAIRRTLILE
jgi:hypothetical protein